MKFFHAEAQRAQRSPAVDAVGASQALAASHPRRKWFAYIKKMPAAPFVRGLMITELVCRNFVFMVFVRVIKSLDRITGSQDNRITGWSYPVNPVILFIQPILMKFFCCSNPEKSGPGVYIPASIKLSGACP